MNNNELASRMYSNPSMMFQPNDRVKVINTHHAPSEGSLTGAEGQFIEYTPKGYARIQTGEQFLLVHPENLQRLVTCAADDCGFYANDQSDYCASHG